MGVDPDNTDYEPGADCVACNATLFDGVTPKYVEAHISDIVKCPGAPGTPPNGVILLTQQMVSCWWTYFNPPIIARYRITAVASMFDYFTGVNAWFFDTTGGGCVDSFINQNVCGVFPAIGTGGTVEIFWGPTIGP